MCVLVSWRYNFLFSWTPCSVNLPGVTYFDQRHRRRIELEDKASRLFGGQNPCRTCYFAPQSVELSWSIWNKGLNSASLFGMNG